MTPDERITMMVNGWTGNQYQKFGGYYLRHDELVQMIREVERDTLDTAIEKIEASWDASLSLKLLKDTLEK